VINCLIIAAVLFFLPLRIGFNDEGIPLLDFYGNKTDFAGVDIDLAADAVGALLLLVVLFIYTKRNPKFTSAARLSVPVLVLSLLTTVQLSGYAVYNAFPKSYNWVFNPTVISEFLFGLLETILLICLLILFGTLMDALVDEAVLRGDTEAVQSGCRVVDLYKKVCWIPLVVTVLSDIISRDSVSDSQMLNNRASTMLIVIRVLYYLSMLLVGGVIVSFLVKVRPEKEGGR